jgi:ABC-type transport system involved in cytochrome bd biosynthesis fused ATPase/permease subunit
MGLNHLINSVLNKIPPPVKVIGGLAIVVILVFFLWYKGTQIWGGIGNWLFHRQINAEREKVQKELESAAEQKKALELTMREFAAAKAELEMVKAEKDRLEKIFNDQSKTASEKVAEFKKAVADDPKHTPTDNVTIGDLCARARAANASAATVAALCGQ